MLRIPLAKRRHEWPPDHLGHSDQDLQRVDHYWNPGMQEDYPIYPFGVEEAVRGLATWYRELHCIYYTIVMLLDGEVLYYVNGQRFHLKKNSVLIIPQGADYNFKTCSKPYYRKLSVFILGVNVSSIMESLNLNIPEIIQVSEIDEMITLVREIDKLIVIHDESDFPKMSGILLEFLGKLSRGKKNDQKGNLMALQIACSRLSSCFERPANIAGLAEELNMSKKTLTRLFQRKLHVSPAKYRIDCRMEQACKLLINTSLSIKEIAADLGYCSQFYFSNEFSRNVGVAPSAYRKSPFPYSPLKSAEE